MKNKNKYIALGSALIFFLLISCSKFDEINTNPDTTTKVPASMLCTHIVLNMLHPGGDAMGYIGSNALPKYVGFAVLGQSGSQYNSIGSGGFGNMTLLPNIDAMLKLSEGSIMESSYKGVAALQKPTPFSI